MKAKKIINDLDTSEHNIGTITGDFKLLDSDPKTNSKKSRKVLTIPKHRRILKDVIKRKDDKAMTVKKTQTNYMQHGATLLLAIGAAYGVTTLLGSTAGAYVVGVILAATLYAWAVDFKI